MYKVNLRVLEADWGKYQIRYIPDLNTVQIFRKHRFWGEKLVADIEAETLRQMLNAPPTP